MSFIIPDNILDTLICDSCNKYLSVKPIMVYPNRRIKCGRCSRSKKHSDGVVSLYKIIAEKCLFKCINRFDGCRELLTYEQVRDHERVCLTKVHQCPICPDNIEVPSFLLIKHFRDNHKETILDYPGLLFNLEQHSQFSQIYLYQQEDNIFFMQFSSSRSEESIQLNLFYLGDSKAANAITQQFSVSSKDEDFKFTSKIKNCTAYGLCNANSFSIKISYSIRTIFIKFYIVFKSPILIHIPLTINSNEASSSIGPQLLSEQMSDITLKTNIFSPMVLETTLRKISLSSNFQNTFPGISLSKCGCAITQAELTYFLHCFNCQEICWRGLSRDILVQKFYFSLKLGHSICYYCFQMLKHEKKVYENEYMVSNFPKDMFKSIEFYCKWKCGKTFIADYHLGHEEACTSQPLKSCPEPKCNFKGTIFEIANHINTHANQDICTYSNFYISCLFDRNIYVLIQDEFVHLKIKNNQGLNISVDAFEPWTKNRRKPLVLLFDDNKLFLMSFQHSITKNEGNHWLKVILMESE